MFTFWNMYSCSKCSILVSYVSELYFIYTTKRKGVMLKLKGKLNIIEHFKKK